MYSVYIRALQINSIHCLAILEKIGFELKEKFNSGQLLGFLKLWYACVRILCKSKESVIGYKRRIITKELS